MKEYILTEIRNTLFGKITNEEISTVIDSISFCLRNYEITAKETSVVVYDNSDMQIINRFFIAKAVEGLCQSSLDYYRIILRAFIIQVGKHIKEIVTDDVRVYLAYKKINKCSDNTLNNIRRTLSSFFTWCTEEGILDRNPMLRIKGVRQVKKLKKPLSEDDMEKLRSLAKTKRNKAIIEFLFSTGCRVSEMVNVNRNDVDWQNGQIDVLGKGRKYRTVYLSARCKIALQEYVDSRTDNLDALFLSDYEGMCQQIKDMNKLSRISRGAVEIMLRNLGKKAGISNVHPHRLRRTAATTALKRGMPIEQVQKMLGHESIETTTIYAQSTNDEVKLAHEKYII